MRSLRNGMLPRRSCLTAAAAVALWACAVVGQEIELTATPQFRPDEHGFGPGSAAPGALDGEDGELTTRHGTRGRAAAQASSDHSHGSGHTGCIHDGLLAFETAQHEASRRARQLRFDSDASLSELGGRTVAWGVPSLGGAAVHLAEERDSEAQAAAARRLAGDWDWAPVRIVPSFVSLVASSSASVADVVTNHIVPRAIRRLQEVLEVKPRSEPLQMNRDCGSFWTNSGGKCAEKPTDPVCGFSSTGSVVRPPTSIIGSSEWYPNGPNLPPSTVAAGGQGIPNTDFLVFVTAIGGSACSGGTLAYAGTCQRDSLDRPIVGLLNFCPSGVQNEATLLSRAQSDPSAANVAAFESALERGVGLAVHEMLHALGYSSDSWYLFRNAQGDPLTPRDATQPQQADASNRRSVTCQGSTFDQSVAAPGIVGYFQERGSDGCDATTLTDPSLCVARLVLPKSRAASRSVFGCTDLPGVELENQPTTDCAVVGSHTEQRSMSGTVMTPFTTSTLTIDAATMAVLEDSSWWRPNYFATDPLRPGRDNVAHTGCSFARDSKCLNPGNPPSVGPTTITRSSGGASVGPLQTMFQPNPFVGCTADRTAVGVTQLGTASTDLLPRYRYYTADSKRGGTIAPTDYCPVVFHYSNRICVDTANNYANGNPANGADPSVTDLGATYGPGSMCVDINGLIRSGRSMSNQPVGTCFAVSCDAASTPGSPIVRITLPSTSSSGTVSATCTTQGQSVSLAGYSGSASCPNPTMVCSTEGPVAPGEEGMVGIAASRVSVIWKETGAAADSAVPVARSLFDAVSGAAALPAATATVELQAISAALLGLSGFTDAVAGQPGVDLGFAGSGGSMSSTAQVSWGAGEAGVKLAALQSIAWPSSSEPKPRVFLVRLTSATGSSSSTTASRALLVLGASNAQAIDPSAAPQPASVALALGAAVALLLASTVHHAGGRAL